MAPLKRKPRDAETVALEVLEDIERIRSYFPQLRHAKKKPKKHTIDNKFNFTAFRSPENSLFGM